MFARLLATLVAALVLTGCSTEEGLRAQELLQRAEAAQRALTSSTFEGSLAVAFGAERISLQFEGATSGEAEWISLRASGIPGAGTFSMQMLIDGGRAWTDVGGRWRPLPLPPRAAEDGTISAEAFRQLAGHVEDVRVTEGQLVDGKAVTTIGGELDTQGLLEAFAELGSVTGELEGLSLDFSELGVDLGDIEALLTIDEASSLLDAAFVSFSMSADGQRAEIELRYRLTSANEPVTLPSP